MLTPPALDLPVLALLSSARDVPAPDELLPKLPSDEPIFENTPFVPPP